MNNLSWLIYLADRIDAISGLFLFLTIVVGMCFIACAIILSPPSPSGPVRTTCRRLMLVCIIFFPIFTSLFVMIPSSKAIYLIAASEIGEQVVTDPEAIEIFNDIKDIVKKELKELK